jgi:uncharacterized protein
VRLRVRDIHESATELAYDEPTSELTPLLEHGGIRDFEFPAPAHVTLRHYRAGRELFFEGEMATEVIGQCARCLGKFAFEHAPRFAFVMVPRHGRWATEDLDAGGDISFYDGEEIDVSPPLRERMILALPTLPLCREQCRGLCAHCGQDLNLATCSCADTGDPRLAVFRGLKLSS